MFFWKIKANAGRTDWKCWKCLYLQRKTWRWWGKEQGMKVFNHKTCKTIWFSKLCTEITFLKKKVFIVVFLFPSVLNTHQRHALHELLKPLSQTSSKCEDFDWQDECFCCQKKMLLESEGEELKEAQHCCVFVIILSRKSVRISQMSLSPRDQVRLLWLGGHRGVGLVLSSTTNH